MNKYILLALVVVLISGCTIDINNPLESESVKQSKAIGVFSHEYVVQNKKIKFESEYFSIKEAWVETGWLYSNNFKKIKFIDEKSLIVNIENSNLGYFNIPLETGRDGVKGYGTSRDGQFIIKLEEYPDTLKLHFWDQKVTFLKKE